MSTLSRDRLGGLALMVGPLLAFVMFSIQPGGALIDTAAPSDPEAAIAALADNLTLTSVTIPLIILGLMAMAYGLYALQVSPQGAGGGAVSGAGMTLVLIGLLLWVWTSAVGMSVAVAADIGAEGELVGIFVARAAVTVMGGAAIALGFLVFTLALPAANALDAWLNRLIALLSLVSLVSFFVAISVWGDLDQGVQLARALYVFWVAWLVYRGLRLLRVDPA